VTRKPHRKSGIRARRRREDKRLLRDQEIYRSIEGYVADGLASHEWLDENIEPLSVYLGIPGNPFNDTLAPFPIRNQANGRPMPQWEDLSAWMKVQLAVMLLHEWTFQTFDIHLHPDLESQWLLEGRDPRMMMRDRLRRELDKSVGPGREFFFVVEGWSKKTRTSTMVHIHGGAAIYDELDDEKIEEAAARACGHGLKGYSRQARAVHSQEFTREGPAYINYLFKAVRTRDPRLPERRLTMSRSIVNATRDFWNTITGRVDW
jgi:hypothetical protein